MAPKGMSSASTKPPKIPFNIPYLTGHEEAYVLQALRSRAHCGNGEFGTRCINLMKQRYGFGEVFLTPSCSAAMEMGVLLAGIGPGNEVVLPSYTFSSTANAIVLQGATPVFCEVEAGTMNIDVKKLEKCITPKTKMIIPIDYAGIPCEIEAINEIAKKHDLVVMVDAAQSFHSYYKGKACGSLSDLAAFSFHETKNNSCGEGGALIVNRPEWVRKAHFIQEKGTNRQLVLDGVISKYHWVSKGSSYLLADILAAMLLAQIEKAEEIVKKREKVTNVYRKITAPFEKKGYIQTPVHRKDVTVNHHAFFVIFDKPENRTTFIAKLKEKNVAVYIGYEPLHSSPMGRRYGYRAEDLPRTETLASRLVRLPFYADLANHGLDYCAAQIEEILASLYG